MKRLWNWVSSLSRFQQIGLCVLAIHGTVILMLLIDHVATPVPKTKKSIAIRTMVMPKIAAKKEVPFQPISPQVKKKSGGTKKEPEKKVAAIGAITKNKIKQDSPALETSTIDNELLQQIAESLGRVAVSPKVSEQPSDFFLPSTIEIKSGSEIPINWPTYGEKVAAILRGSLDLPEFGEVVAKIEINANGSVDSCEILKTRSWRNGEFLKKRLRELAFPCFNEFGLSENRLSFTITFHNVENH